MVFVLSLCLFGGLQAQEPIPDTENNTKIIIIEEKVDEMGNKTVKKSVREGNYSDEEIEKIIELETSEHAPVTVSGKGYLGVMIEDDPAGVRITEILDEKSCESGWSSGR